jgi:uncharacterized protein YggE
MKQSFNLKALVIVVLLALIGALLAAPASAQEAPPRSLTVNGSGLAYGSPDIAYVQLGVQITSDDVAAGFAQVNDAVTQVLAALRAAGIADADLQTTGLFIYQDTYFDPAMSGRGENTIFRLGNSVNVTIRDVNQVSAVIQAGVNAGANSINSLSFGIADRTALESEARADAVADARARAEELAQLMGVSLGEPLVIVEGGAEGFFPLAEARAMGMGGAGVPIEAGQLSVNVNVRVTFAIT